MKTGIIVYFYGSEPLEWNAEDAAAHIKKSAGADLVEIITDKSGHLSVSDAWRMLLARGMNHIFCMTGEFTSTGSLRLKEDRLRLCG